MQLLNDESDNFMNSYLGLKFKFNMAFGNIVEKLFTHSTSLMHLSCMKKWNFTNFRMIKIINYRLINDAIL